MKNRLAKSMVATGLSLVLAALCAGLEPYQAVAAIVEGQAPAGQPGAPIAELPELSLPSAAPGLTQTPALPSSIVSAPSVQAAAAPQAAQAPQVAAPAVAIRALASGVQQLGQAKTGGDKAGVLGRLFERLGGRAGDALTPSPAGPSEPSGPSEASGLSKLSSSSLEALASDPAKPDADRRSAVKELARAKDLAALERVGLGEATGPSASDYEIRRAALGALAELGKVVSLPSISRAHAEAILARLRKSKPAVAAFDFDGTLEPEGIDKISSETGRLLSGVADAGVETMILTGRSDRQRWRGGRLFLDLLSDIPAGELSKISAGVEQGSRMYVFDRQGRPHLAREQAGWTPAQDLNVQDAVIAAFQRFGGTRGASTDRKAILNLPSTLTAGEVEQAARMVRDSLARKNVPARVLPRGLEHGQPYLFIVRSDKSEGMTSLRASLRYFRRLRASYRSLPRFLQGTYQKAVSKLSESSVEPSQVLAVGDEFFGDGGVDSPMIKGAPGALALAVGGEADPRLPNVFVWPAKGPEAAREIAGALAVQASRPGEQAPGPDDPVNNKTLAALILQRLPSMAAYMLVTIAFVAVAVPIVGWTGYGVLMSLSPMAGIAAAKLMAGAIKNMNARSAMALNTILRFGSLIALPAFHFFGILNVGTVLVGALAEGFLLSSILVTEGSFLKVLFPAKQLGNINGALFMMFPGVQVLLGLFLHVGKFADLISPFAIYTGAAFVNVLMVLPIILWGIPRIKLSTANAAPAKARPSVLIALKSSWKPAALFLAGVGIFAGLTFGMPALASFGSSLGWAWPGVAAAFIKAHQGLTAPLPILGALVYWIVKSDAFRSLRSGRTAQAGKAEQALRDERAAAQARGASPADLAQLDARLKPYEGRQMRSVWLMAASTLLYYPLYLVVAPHVAEILVGSASKGQMIGQFLGSLFFGGLLSTAARTKLPEVGITIGGKRRAIGAHLLVQAGVVVMAGVWAATLAPGVLAFLGGAAAAAALIAVSRRVTDRGWVQMLGIGASVIWLPFIVWAWPALLPFLSIKAAMYLALLAVGLFNGPSFVSLISYMQRNTLPAESSQVQGIQGATFNAAISAAYALLTIVSGFLNPAYPAVLALLGVLSAVLGVVFWRAPKGLPGLSPHILEPRRKAPQTPAGGKS